MALFRYTYEVKHTELGKYRVVSGTDDAIVRAKAEALLETWRAEYERKLAKDRFNVEREATRRKMRQQKEKTKEQLEDSLQEANDLTDEAKTALAQITNILHTALSSRYAVNWDKLKRKDSFSKPKPAEPSYLKFRREPQPDGARYTPPPETPIFSEYPPEPQLDNFKYQPVLTLFDKLWGGCL